MKRIIVCVLFASVVSFAADAQAGKAGMSADRAYDRGSRALDQRQWEQAAKAGSRVDGASTGRHLPGAGWDKAPMH